MIHNEHHLVTNQPCFSNFPWKLVGNTAEEKTDSVLDLYVCFFLTLLKRSSKLDKLTNINIFDS